MTFFNQSYRRGLLIVTSAALGSIALFGISTFLLASSKAHQLTAAKKKWVRQPVPHYRLSINYSTYDDCQQEVEVQNEKVIAVRQNTCPTIPALTVTDLFKQVESSASSKQCGPNGCACDGRIGVDTIYDAQFGYPSQVEIRLKPEERWLYKESWNNLFAGRECTLIGFIDQKITVRAFSPIQ